MCLQIPARMLLRSAAAQLRAALLAHTYNLVNTLPSCAMHMGLVADPKQAPSLPMLAADRLLSVIVLKTDV